MENNQQVTLSTVDSLRIVCHLKSSYFVGIEFASDINIIRLEYVGDKNHLIRFFMYNPAWFHMYDNKLETRSFSVFNDYDFW